MNDGDLPSILQDQNGPGSQKPSVRFASPSAHRPSLLSSRLVFPQWPHQLRRHVFASLEYQGNWQTHTGMMQPEIPAMPGNHWGHRHTQEGKAQELQTIQKGHGPIPSIYKLNTPDHVFFQEEESVGRKRDKSKEVVLDASPRAKFPLCTMVLPQLASVIHYSKIGFSFAWKVFLPLAFTSPRVLQKSCCGVLFFFLSIYVSLFICFKFP